MEREEGDGAGGMEKPDVTQRERDDLRENGFFVITTQLPLGIGSSSVVWLGVGRGKGKVAIKQSAGNMEGKLQLRHEFIMLDRLGVVVKSAKACGSAEQGDGQPQEDRQQEEQRTEAVRSGIALCYGFVSSTPSSFIIREWCKGGSLLYHPSAPAPVSLSNIYNIRDARKICGDILTAGTWTGGRL